MLSYYFTVYTSQLLLKRCPHHLNINSPTPFTTIINFVRLFTLQYQEIKRKSEIWLQNYKQRHKGDPKTLLPQAPSSKQAHLAFISLNTPILFTLSLTSLTNSELQNKNEESALVKKNIECGKLNSYFKEYFKYFSAY